MEYFFVYILRCSDGSYYTGHTDNLELRIAQHQSGELKCYTLNRLPVDFVFSESFDSRDMAFAVEHQIKKWSRAKKRSLN